MKFWLPLITIPSFLVCDAEWGEKIKGFEYMAKKIWDDWEEIGDVMATGRKFVIGCIIFGLLIAIFVPFMA